jgi:hypothetical protein
VTLTDLLDQAPDHLLVTAPVPINEHGMSSCQDTFNAARVHGMRVTQPVHLLDEGVSPAQACLQRRQLAPVHVVTNIPGPSQTHRPVCSLRNEQSASAQMAASAYHIHSARAAFVLPPHAGLHKPLLHCQLPKHRFGTVVQMH